MLWKTKKDTTSVIIATVAKREKILHQKHESYTFELPMIIVISERYIFRKRPKSLKTFFYFMTNFHNFALKTEAGRTWLTPFCKLEMSMRYACMI